jgi:hypothetical protein
MLNPDTANLLYLLPPTAKPVTNPSLYILLYPQAGPKGTLQHIAKRARRPSDSLDLPFASYDQNALLYILLTAINEPHRGKLQTTRKRASTPKRHNVIITLSDEHHIFKAWLQYFRATLLKLPIKEIVSSTQLNISRETYRRWERPSPYLPPTYWFPYLWKWWSVSICVPDNPPSFTTITSESERISIRKHIDPRYYYRLDLINLKGDLTS